MYVKSSALKYILLVIITLLNLLLINSVIAQESQENPFASLNWQLGPKEVTIANKAKLFIPEGFGFLDVKDTDKFLEALHNLPTGRDYLIVPENDNWFATFSFDPIGYVKDNEKIDPDSIISTVKSATKEANKEKKRRGWGTMTITGWRFEPQYDRTTKLLEWAINAKDDESGETGVNYNTRILGREGVMQVILVDSAEKLDQSVAILKDILKRFEYLPGQKYAEYKKGDKIAEYGLAALIAGGTAAAVAKSGFGKAIWKFLVVGVAALFAGLKSLFKRKA